MWFLLCCFGRWGPLSAEWLFLTGECFFPVRETRTRAHELGRKKKPPANMREEITFWTRGWTFLIWILDL
jgi:hypothetical protein